MANYINFYEGGGYGLESNDYDSKFPPLFNYNGRILAGNFALTSSNPNVANQITAVSNILSTGVKNIEITAINPKILEAIPEQHLQEVRRLAEITGAELTFHGPILEPTGIIQQGGWDETNRKNAERQMLQAVERAHSLDPKGNIIVTFHSSAALPETETKIITKDKDGNEIEKTVQIAVIDERTGRWGHIPKPKKNEWTDEEADPEKERQRYNKENWNENLNSLTLAAQRGLENVEEALATKDIIGGQKAEAPKEIMGLYKLSKEDPESYNKKITSIKEEDPSLARTYERIVWNLGQGRIHVRNAYAQFQEAFSKAYESTSGKDWEKLDNFKKEVATKIKGYDEDPTKIEELAKEITRGVQILSTLDKTPEIYKPMREFAIDKASETFSNIAFEAYNKFKDNTPVISIENPPIGTGLSRADELKELIDATRKKFVQKAEEKGMPSWMAENEAKKLIGATWDVGHINMLRRYGHGTKELIKETKKIAEDIKHIHLSDNFGMEHTELPMGMGNVPTKEHLEVIKKYKGQFEKIKQVIETGDWYQQFQTSPFKETLAEFGSPIYAMQAGPYWSKQSSMMGNYFSGFGLNPEHHHSIYGSGFAGLPIELGGQVPGGRSRLSGAPIE